MVKFTDDQFDVLADAANTLQDMINEERISLCVHITKTIECIEAIVKILNCGEVVRDE
jgi:hypothetical protein